METPYSLASSSGEKNAADASSFTHYERVLPRIMCFLAAVVFLLGCGSPANADKEATLKAIIRAWKKREQETIFFRFEWMEKVFMPKEQLPVPAAEDATFEKKSSVSISGSRMTTFSEGPAWNRNRFIPELYRSVFDGTSSKSFHAPTAKEAHPVGNINNLRMNQDADSNFSVSIQLAFRAFHPVLGRFDEDKMQVVDEKEFIRNKECIRVEQKKPTYIARCWVDPTREYVIVRYAMIFDGFPDYQCDVEYKLDNKFGWLPGSWHDVLTNNNVTPARLSEDRVAQVTSFAINGPVENQEFQLEFPPGTEVKDWINDQRFVVLDDGSKRVATNAENQRGITYDELLHTKEKTKDRNLRARSLLAAAIFAGIGLLILWLRMKRRKLA